MAHGMPVGQVHPGGSEEEVLRHASIADQLASRYPAGRAIAAAAGRSRPRPQRERSSTRCMATAGRTGCTKAGADRLAAADVAASGLRSPRSTASTARWKPSPASWTAAGAGQEYPLPDRREETAARWLDRADEHAFLGRRDRHRHGDRILALEPVRRQADVIRNRIPRRSLPRLSGTGSSGADVGHISTRCISSSARTPRLPSRRCQLTTERYDQREDRGAVLLPTGSMIGARRARFQRLPAGGVLACRGGGAGVADAVFAAGGGDAAFRPSSPSSARWPRASRVSSTEGGKRPSRTSCPGGRRGARRSWASARCGSSACRSPARCPCGDAPCARKGARTSSCCRRRGAERRPGFRRRRRRASCAGACGGGPRWQPSRGRNMLPARAHRICELGTTSSTAPSRRRK